MTSYGYSNSSNANTTSQNDYNNDVKPSNTCPPLSESISDIAWISNQVANVFAATTWDGNLRVFEVQTGYGNAINSKLQVKINSPLTACCWSPDNSAIFVGCGAGSIKAVDINSSNVMDIGKQNSGISGLHYVASQGCVMSTAYESNVGFWKPGNNGPVFNLDLGNKVFCSDFVNGIFAAGC